MKMRASAGALMGLGAAALLLAGCGKKTEAPVMPSSTPLETSSENTSAAS